MQEVYKRFFIIIVPLLSFVFLLKPQISNAMQLDLTSAQDSVGKRFASKFCEAKEEGFSSE